MTFKIQMKTEKNMNEENLVNITPDVRLLKVLRNTGFSNEAAMGEILDNSIDAGASYIDVYIQEREGKLELIIVDNGRGMSKGTLQGALTLAKELKTGLDQLGKYGMGMKTAALSMSTQMEIYTKTINNPVLFGEFNMNKMIHLEEFKTEVREADETELEFFEEKMKQNCGSVKSGTIILLKACDGIQWKRPSAFVDNIKKYIALTYRHYILRGHHFTINEGFKKGEKIEAIDVLMRDHEKTTIFCEREPFTISYKERGGKIKSSFIEVSAVILPESEFRKKMSYVDGQIVPITINAANQGIYFTREGRMVSPALKPKDVWGEGHPSKNRWRVEVNVKETIDDEIRMDFRKGNVAPTTHFKEQLNEILEPIFEKMREFMTEQKKSNRKGTISNVSDEKDNQTFQTKNEEKTLENTEEKEPFQIFDKKDLPDLSKYAFIEGKNTKPVVIEKELDFTYLVTQAENLVEKMTRPDVPENIKEEIKKILEKIM